MAPGSSTRLRKILRGLGFAVVGLAALAALAYVTRSNPVGPISGRALSGELVAAPVVDWTFTDEHSLIAVETRPAEPHSVTTVCFTHDGVLYVPAMNGSAKAWPHFAVSLPSARILVDGKIYPVQLTRVTDPSLVPDLRRAVAAKYDFVSADTPGVEDIWLFRADSIVPAVAAE
jgi:hypothetical protein